MKNISMKWLLLVVISIVFSASTVYAGGAVVITEPATGSTVSSPEGMHGCSWSGNSTGEKGS